MCTAYELGKRQGQTFPRWMIDDAIKTLFELSDRIVVRPTHSAPVILRDGSLRMMSWGFRRPVLGKTKLLWRTVVNSREDKLTGRTWKEAFAERRCLIPAAAFYEWVPGPGKSKIPLRFERPGEEWIWIAGIWETDKELGNVFSMITTEPTLEIGPIHDRMPAVLAEDRLRSFLDGEIHEFGPSPVPLQWKETENFLKKAVPPPDQGELL